MIKLQKGFAKYPVLGIFTALLVAFMLTVNAAAPSDSEILHIVKTTNNAEISAGSVATTKAENPKVREFAQMMVKAHTDNNKKLDKVSSKNSISLQDNSTSQATMADGESKLSDLNKTASTKDFDRTYMDQQISMHKQVLSDLDSKLIPSAQNREVKKHLQETKKHVASHLNQANQIRATLN